MTINDQFSDSPELISELSPEEQKIADVIENLLRPLDICLMKRCGYDYPR